MFALFGVVYIVFGASKWGLHGKQNASSIYMALSRDIPFPFMSCLKPPALQADDPDDAFTPIWVFAPGEGTFKVYKQFDVVPADPKNANSVPTFQEPSKPYSHVEWFKPFSTNEE